MPLQPKPHYRFDDYLSAERESIDEKHEYVAGHVYAMTGASYNHNVITQNLARNLGNRLESRPCIVMASDMRIRIETADAGKYPDIVVLCDPPVFYDERKDVLTNPILLVEVLSPSTEGYDRGGKFAIYRHLESLRQYILVAQDRISVDVFTRQSDDRWLLDSYAGPDGVLDLESIGCKVRLRDIYAKVLPANQ